MKPGVTGAGMSQILFKNKHAMPCYAMLMKPSETVSPYDSSYLTIPIVYIDLLCATVEWSSQVINVPAHKVVFLAACQSIASLDRSGNVLLCHVKPSSKTMSAPCLHACEA